MSRSFQVGDTKQFTSHLQLDMSNVSSLWPTGTTLHTHRNIGCVGKLSHWQNCQILVHLAGCINHHPLNKGWVNLVGLFYSEVAVLGFFTTSILSSEWALDFFVCLNDLWLFVSDIYSCIFWIWLGYPTQNLSFWAIVFHSGKFEGTKALMKKYYWLVLKSKIYFACLSFTSSYFWFQLRSFHSGLFHSILDFILSPVCSQTIMERNYKAIKPSPLLTGSGGAC